MKTATPATAPATVAKEAQAVIVPVMPEVAKTSLANPAYTIATDGLVKAKGLAGEALRLTLSACVTQLQTVKPEKPVFSSDKAQRKLQMSAYKVADKAFRSQIGRLYRALEEAGAEHKDRHSATLSASGIVTVRRSESLTLRPASSKGSRISL